MGVGEGELLGVGDIVGVDEGVDDGVGVTENTIVGVWVGV